MKPISKTIDEIRTVWNNNELDSRRIDTKIRDILNPDIGGKGLIGDPEALGDLLANILLLCMELVGKLPEARIDVAKTELITPLQTIRNEVVFGNREPEQSDLITTEDVLLKAYIYKQELLGITYEEDDQFKSEEEYHADYFGVHADWLKKQRLERDKKKN